MGRISRSFQLLGVAWSVLVRDKQLMLLPVMSFACFFAIVTVMGFGAYQAGLLSDVPEPTTSHYVALGIFYFVMYFIGIFFNAAIVACAMIRLNGGTPTLRDGLNLAFEKIDKILAWALVSATVGVFMRALEERAGLLGRIAIAFINAVWAALTFFVVPVILFEPVGVTESIKRSSRIFRDRWGETFIGNGSIGLAMTLIMIPVIIVVAMTFSVSPALGVVLGIVSLGTIVAAGSAMTGIYNAALYRYAVAGIAGGGFADGDLRTAFVPKKGKKAAPVISEFFAEDLARAEALRREREAAQQTPVIEPGMPQDPPSGDVPPGV